MEDIVQAFNFNPELLEMCFTDKVREMCKSCKRFGKKAQCPPHLESVSYYKKLLPTFNSGILFLEVYNIDDIAKWKELGERSSKDIQQTLINKRTELFNQGIFAIGFAAGSCKNCQDCRFPCKYPDKSFAPIEGTGLDVIALVWAVTKKELKFPVKDFFCRVGMILYDKK